MGDDFADRHEPRIFVRDHQGIDRNRHFAVGKRVEGVHHLGGVGSPLEFDLDLHLLRCEIVDAGDFYLVLLGRAFYGGDEGLSGDAEGQFGDEDALGIGRVQFGADQDLAHAVLVVGDIHFPPGGKIGIELGSFAAQPVFDRRQHLDKIMRQDLGGHTHGDALRAHRQHQGDLGRESDRFPVAAVVGVLVLRDLGIVEDLLGQGEKAAFNVPGGGGFVAGEDVAEVPLAVDEQFLLGEDHQRRIDGGVPVRVILHAVAHHVGHLVELAVVHLHQRVKDAPLHGLEPVVQVRDGPVLDDVGRVFQKVGVEKRFDVGHAKSGSP